MTSVSKLARQISEALRDNGRAPLESLAAEYARFCQEANQRLESCAAMIEKGSDHQALQLAETEPPLLDLIGALSFAEAPQWAALCEAQQLSTPPKFDARAIQALDRLYGQGIAANHPLYKEYRAAVTSRDDAKALQTVRSIVRLNPGDANAKAELARIENKMFQLRLGPLRAALAQGDEGAVLADLEEIERLGTAALEKLPEYAKACDLRRAVQQREARMTAERLLASLEAERQADAWQVVGDILKRLDALQAEHTFTLSGAANEKRAEMQRYYQARCSAKKEAARYERAIADLEALAEDFDHAVAKRGSLTLAKARKMQGEFNVRWQEIEQLRRPIPEAFRQRVQTTVAALRGELERLQRARRIKVVTTSVGVAAVFGAASWFAVIAVRAQDYATQLGRLRDGGQVIAVEKLAAGVRTNHTILAKRPGLASRLDEVEHWAQEERHKLAGVEVHLSELEKTDGMGRTNVFVFAAKLDSTDRLIDSLAVDLRPAPASRVLVVRNQFDADLVSSGKQMAEKEETLLAELETIAGEQLGFDRKKETLSVDVAAIDIKLKKLEPWTKTSPALAALEMPSALKLRVVALRKRVDLFRLELDRLAQVNEALLQAKSLEAYLGVLARYRASRLTQPPEIIAAQKLLAALPEADDLFAGMLMPGDASGWAAAKADATGAMMMPDTVLPTEVGSLVRLHEDRYLNDIWEVSFTDFRQKKKQRDLYSRGEPLRERPRVAGDNQSKTSSVALYDPARKSATPLFVPTTVSFSRNSMGVTGDGEITASHLSSASACLARLGLNRMTDPTGNKYERPLLQVFDGLVQEKAAHPVFKAYLMQQLGTVLKGRPDAWGLEYCASLRSDLAELDGLCGRAPLHSEDWLTERKRQELGPKLTGFFAGLHQRRYFLEAQLQREVIRGGLRAGLRFGGFVDGSGQAHLLGEARRTKTLWAFAHEPQKLVQYPANTFSASTAKDSTPQVEAFSPVFFVSLDRDTLRQTLERLMAGVPGGQIKLPSNPWLEMP